MIDLNPCKKDLNLVYKMKLLFEDQTQEFESSSFGFESPLLMNSNIAQEIQILELLIRVSLSTGAFNTWSERLITLNFKDFLFHNGL